MTKQDLKLEYLKETGKKIPSALNFPYTLWTDRDFISIHNYLNWLEEEHLQLRNQLGINERAKNKIKNMK